MIINVRGVLKFFTKDNGEQSAMISGISMMLRSFADSLGVASPCRHQELPSLGKALELFSWMMYSAEAMNFTYGNAPTTVGQYITVATMKMPALSAQVLSALFYSFQEFPIRYILKYS